MSLREGIVRISGSVVLPYVEHGDPGGAPVVLLHAYADSWRSWEGVLPRLPSWVHALAPTDLAIGKASRCPAALVRGLGLPPGDGRAADLVREAPEDMFR